MRLPLKLLLMLLAAPILAVAVGIGAHHQADVNLRKAIRAQALMARGAVDEGRLAAVSMADFCADAATRNLPDGFSGCSTYAMFSLLAFGGGCAAALGLALVVAIAWAGRACQRDRLLLLKVFTPGLRAVFVVLVVLILVHAALVVGGLALLGARGSAMGRLMVMVGIGAIVGVYKMIGAASHAVEKASAAVVGKVLEDAKHLALRNTVNEVARTIGTAGPGRIVAGLDPNFFVTESDVTCLDGQLRGRTLYLSLPLCRILTVPELRAIVGHELGHFKGLDTQFSQRFYPIYAGASRSLMALAQSTGGARSVAILPAFYLLAFFLDSFATAEASSSREREIAADAEAARAAGTTSAASALVKAHAFAPAWGAVLQAMHAALAGPQALTNVSVVFADVVRHAAAPERLHDAMDARVVHPTDSHPPLCDRLRALGRTVEDVTEAALALPPDAPAIGLFDDVERLEEELSKAQQEWLRNQLQLEPSAASA